jgi:hypothetical protein
LQKDQAMSTISLEYGANREATKSADIVGAIPFIREMRERRVRRKALDATLRPMTMEEFRADIDCAMEDYRAGRTITSAELKKRMASW